VHGAFVSDEEVHRVVEHLKSFGEPDYEESILAVPESEEIQLELGADAGDVEADPLYDEAAAYVIRSRRASISSVQRQFRIGYNRAARWWNRWKAPAFCRPCRAMVRAMYWHRRRQIEHRPG